MVTTATRSARGQTLAGAALELIHTGRAPTRAALTASLGVTRATAGAVTAELQARRLITVDSGTGAGAGTFGRPSHGLAIDPGGPVALAAQIHPDGFQVALTGLGGRIVAEASGELTAPDDPVRAVAPVAEAGARLLRMAGRMCVGAVLAVPSAITEPEGAAVSPLYVAWPTGARIRDIFAGEIERAGITGPALMCSVANDINLMALAEHRHGAGRDAQHLLVIATGHRGVGGALVLDGMVYTGSTGLGMEAGHVSVDPRGRPCRCGNRGCLDVETDALTFIELAGRVPGTNLSDQATALLRDEHGTDPAVSAAAGTVIERLGLGLAGLINVLNPDLILLGGLHKDLLAADPVRLRAAVAERSPWGRGSSVPVLSCALDNGSLIGAAELAWHPVLRDPGILDA